MIPSPQPRRRPDFSLATINIVFLLLLFFLAVGTIADRQELAVEAPQTRELPLDRLPRPLLVIDKDGTLRLDGQSVENENLEQAALAITDKSQQTALPINVLAAADLPGRELVEIVARLSAAQLKVKLVTLRSGKP